MGVLIWQYQLCSFNLGDTKSNRFLYEIIIIHSFSTGDCIEYQVLSILSYIIPDSINLTMENMSYDNQKNEYLNKVIVKISMVFCLLFVFRAVFLSASTCFRPSAPVCGSGAKNCRLSLPGPSQAKQKKISRLRRRPRNSSGCE